MTRAGVRELLGPSCFDEAEVLYNMLGSGLIDPWLFSITFDGDGKVQAYRKFNG